MGWQSGPWTVVIPGQPPSGNHANKIGRGYRRGGIPYPKMIKTDAALAYQQGAALIVKTSKPSGWHWAGGMVVAEYHLFLRVEADCTNVWKTVEDAVFPALGINDSYCLPRAMSKTIVPAKDAHITINIYNRGEHTPWLNENSSE
jgi:hypothetical protein